MQTLSWPQIIAIYTLSIILLYNIACIVKTVSELKKLERELAFARAKYIEDLKEVIEILQHPIN
jgi:hypothetical protein